MGQPIEGSNPSLSATALAGSTEAATRGPRRPRGGGLVDGAGRGCPPSIDLRLRVSKPDRRGASLGGEPDRRPSRPVVSPTYAQGSYYGRNRVVASAPGLLTGPATPLLSTTRAAQPPGRDPSRAGSHVVRTGRVSRKNGTARTRERGRGDPRARTGTRARRWSFGLPRRRKNGTRGARRRRPPPARAAPRALPGPLL
jgi:hypothetical protein